MPARTKPPARADNPITALPQPYLVTAASLWQTTCTCMHAARTLLCMFASFRNTFNMDFWTSNYAPPRFQLQTYGQRLCLAYLLKTLRISSLATSTLATNYFLIQPFLNHGCQPSNFHLLCVGRLLYVHVLVLLCVCTFALYWWLMSKWGECVLLWHYVYDYLFWGHYSSIPGHRNWQIETAAWKLDVRLDYKERNSIDA